MIYVFYSVGARQFCYFSYFSSFLFAWEKLLYGSDLKWTWSRPRGELRGNEHVVWYVRRRVHHVSMNIFFFFSKKWIAILQCLLWCPPATVIQQLLTRSFIVAFALFVHIHIWLLAGFGGWRGYVTSLTPAHRTATQHNLCIPTLRYDFLFNHILSWLFHARPY